MSCYVTHLESALDGTRLPADRLQTLHEGRPLWVRYDLPAIGNALSKERLQQRPATMWRYQELLPPRDPADTVSLQEQTTPLVTCPRLAAHFGLNRLLVKDESRLPTGSFKARGMAMAVTMARQFGVQRVAVPTAGNAGGAMAAYAARAAMEAFVFMPRDTPIVNQWECRLAGAKTYLVEGLINDCGRVVADGKETIGWFDLSTLKEPYRLEGKKTMGLELAEQLDWRLPDVILYPTGGGTGLIGMWKAFAELAALGWLADQRRPRMVAVQSTGCDPIVRAFESGSRFANPVPDAHTVAAGIRVPAAVGDFMILDALSQSGGAAIAAEEARIAEWMRLGAATTGLSICPEAAACIGALEQLTADGWIEPDEQVVLFNTGAAQKYPEAMAATLPLLDTRRPIDWAWIAGQ